MPSEPPLRENFERNCPRGRVTSNSCPTLTPCCAPASMNRRSPCPNKRRACSCSAPTICGWPTGDCCSMKPPHATSLLRAAGAGLRSLRLTAAGGGGCCWAGEPPVCALAGAAPGAQNRSTKASTLQKVSGLLLRTGNLLVSLSHQRRLNCGRPFVPEVSEAEGRGER